MSNLIREAVRMIISEISLAQAESSARNTATKMVKSLNFTIGNDPNERVDAISNNLFTYIKTFIPDDIEEKQKALSLLWVTRILKQRSEENPKMPWDDNLDSVFWRMEARSVRSDLEIFFHWQKFMAIKDLNRINSFDQLNTNVENAKSAIEEYQSAQEYKDADAGTEILRNDSEWKVAIMHNKGAACHLGKGTDWCTAAPGLDYFKHYYKPNDPLFYLEDKTTGEKFQVHFGTDQFMDKNDSIVANHKDIKLTTLLNDLVGERYPIIKLKLISLATASWNLSMNYKEAAISAEKSIKELKKLSEYKNEELYIKTLNELIDSQLLSDKMIEEIYYDTIENLKSASSTVADMLKDILLSIARNENTSDSVLRNMVNLRYRFFDPSRSKSLGIEDNAFLKFHIALAERNVDNETLHDLTPFPAVKREIESNFR